jgi:hypothetical protein
MKNEFVKMKYDFMHNPYLEQSLVLKNVVLMKFLKKYKTLRKYKTRRKEKIDKIPFNI